MQSRKAVLEHRTSQYCKAMNQLMDKVQKGECDLSLIEYTHKRARKLKEIRRW